MYKSEILLNKSNIKILTPNGYQDFDGIKKIKQKRLMYRIFFDRDYIQVTENHKLKSTKGFIVAHKLIINDILIHKNKNTTITNIETYFSEEYVYDLLDVKNGNEYYTNKLISHNCSFSGSSHTLIKSDIMEKLVKSESLSVDAIVEKGKMYYEFNENSNYLITVDSSKSLGDDEENDFLSVNVLELNSKIKQAFTFRTNSIHYKDASKIIYSIGEYYNFPLVAVENNEGSGTYIVNNLLDELEYPEIYFDPNKDGLEAGIRTTRKNRPVGLSTLKKLIEKGIFEIIDADTIDEFLTFIKVHGKYQADKGNTDDCVMSLCVGMYVLLDKNNDLEITIEDYLDEMISEVIEDDTKDINFFSGKGMKDEEDKSWMY